MVVCLGTRAMGSEAVGHSNRHTTRTGDTNRVTPTLGSVISGRNGVGIRDRDSEALTPGEELP